MKYRIIDWAGNICFNDQLFSSFEDACSYIYERFPNGDEDNTFDDYFVIPIEGSDITSINNLAEIISSWSAEDCMEYLKDHGHMDYFKQTWLLEIIELDEPESLHPEFLKSPSTFNKRN